jgi:MraZ protein
MLIGSYTHNVDVKGRIFIPAKWRVDLGDTIIVTRGLMGGGDSKCLFAMSAEAWKEYAARFSQLPVTDANAQDIRRITFANACDCEPDKQGRILIPSGLREFAALEDEATLIGVDNRVEIWSAKNWERKNAAIAERCDKELERLASMGI